MNNNLLATSRSPISTNHINNNDPKGVKMKYITTIAVAFLGVLAWNASPASAQALPPPDDSQIDLSAQWGASTQYRLNRYTNNPDLPHSGYLLRQVEEEIAKCASRDAEAQLLDDSYEASYRDIIESDGFSPSVEVFIAYEVLRDSYKASVEADRDISRVFNDCPRKHYRDHDVRLNTIKDRESVEEAFLSTRPKLRFWLGYSRNSLTHGIYIPSEWMF